MYAKFLEIVQQAIDIEEKMHQFYLKMASKVKDKQTQEAFQGLAEEEKEHKVLLEDYLKKGVFPPIAGIKDADLEAPQGLPPITEEMPATDALTFAIRSEEFQHQFYKKLALSYPPGEIRGFLKKMAAIELTHKERIETIQGWMSRF